MEKSKSTSHNMAPILEKLERYFEDYEFGVYKEASDDKDGAVWTVQPSDNKVGYLKAMNAQGKHIFIRPTFEKEGMFMMHDDVDKDGLEKHHMQNGKWKPGRLVVESSPGNYQVWIKSTRPLNVDEKKYWLDKMDSDPGASPLHRWGRSPGFRNRKQKYKTEQGWPLARLYHIDWARLASIPKIINEQKTEEKTAPTQRPERPKRNIRHTNKPVTICRDDYYKGVDKKGKIKESEQDLSYALALLRRGVPRYEVEDRILRERTDWTKHQGEKRKQHYLTKTLDKAEAIINHSTYQVTVKNTSKNMQRTETLRDVHKDETEKVLSEKVRKMAVRLGFETLDEIETKVHKMGGKKKTEKGMNIQIEMDKNHDGQEGFL